MTARDADGGGSAGKADYAIILLRLSFLLLFSSLFSLFFLDEFLSKSNGFGLIMLEEVLHEFDGIEFVLLEKVLNQLD